MYSPRPRTLLLPAAALAAAVLVSGCGGQDSTSATTSASPSRAAAAAPASTPLTITDPWVKTSEKGMTAAFGTLVNNTDTELTVVSGASPLSPKVELHEVVDSGGKMVMRPKKGGFVVPAHGSHQLAPGSDHIMLIGITGKVEPGAEVPFTLTLANGGTVQFTAIGKEFAGGKEDYRPGKSGMDMGGEDKS
ncbi:copper chaperone PCu(A)C [Nonomuraea sp. NPDC000554]|uniref:copper chaperone PCu(A)C n=1 Tax=Nonomuraea sp. NPDC000554 TaxID=3154259 RepID=UPI0033229B19